VNKNKNPLKKEKKLQRTKRKRRQEATTIHRNEKKAQPKQKNT
jgi:hypothetical protein